MKYRAVAPPSWLPQEPSLPLCVNLFPGCSPVVDQGQEGSCTGHALTKMLEYALRKAGKNPPLLSRQMTYALERIAENDLSQDPGADPSDGVRALLQIGTCEESLWPYTGADEFMKPSADAYANAAKYRAPSAVRLFTQQDCLNSLASGWVFAIAIQVFPSFESSAVATSGVVPMPGPSEQPIGGHEVYVVGYDMIKQQWLCVNSWGTNWGQAGLFWLPFEYLASYVSSIWSIRA